MMSIVFELIILLFTTIVNFILAVVVFAKNPRRNVNGYFALFALSLIGWAVTNYYSIHPVIFDQLLWIRTSIAWANIMSMMLLLLVNIFPTGVPYYRKFGTYVVISGAIIALLALSPWLFTGIIYVNNMVEPTPGPALPLFVAYVILALTLSIRMLIRKFRSSRGIPKEYIRYAIIGIVSTFILLVIFNFILVLAFHNTSFIMLTPSFTLLFSVSFAYGMIRHRLFDIRLVVARFLAYLLLLLVIGTAYGFAVVAVSYVVAGIKVDMTQVAISTAVVGVLILFVEPLRLFINQLTRMLFYQDSYDTKKILDKLSSILVRSTATHTITIGSLTILREALKSEFIVILLLGGANKEGQRFVDIGQNAPNFSKADLVSYLHNTPDFIVIDTLENHQSMHLHKKMQEANVSVVARLKTRNGTIGYCFFGYKTSGTVYNHKDTDLIRIASGELAIALQNALSFEQISDFNITLQQRVEEATKKLRATNVKLKQLDEIKDEFVSMASHQLRTPLTSVKGYLSMVLEGDVGKITDTQRQLLSEAFTSSERMVHLIGDFLNVSRLQTGKFVLEQRVVNLALITEQEVRSLETTAAAHNMKLEYHKPSYFPDMYIDEDKVRQVIMNFIDNAVFYSEPHTAIIITLSVEDGNAVLRVVDTGIGVPKDEQSHLFTKFFRASNARKQRPDGTGIGLFLAKKVIMAHGGSVVFESAEDKGSVFGFRLPIKLLSATKKTDKLKN